MESLLNVNDLFPTLFSKTLFIVSVQLFITWLTTYFIFEFFISIDPKLETENPYTDGAQDKPLFARMAQDTTPQYRWVFSQGFFLFILALSFGIFLLLLFWGINQSLGISFSLFSAWSLLMGMQLEYALLNIEQGLGRKVLALTSLIVLVTALIGMYSHVDFGFLQLPLFIVLSIFVLISLFQITSSMSTAKQRISSAVGVVIFTLYLVFDFNQLVKKENASDNTWPGAMHFAIKIYLDIINLFLQLLSHLSKGHH